KIPGSTTRASAVTSSLTMLQAPGNTGLGRRGQALPMEALQEADHHRDHVPDVIGLPGARAVLVLTGNRIPRPPPRWPTLANSALNCSQPAPAGPGRDFGWESQPNASGLAVLAPPVQSPARKAALVGASRVGIRNGINRLAQSI
ncbi:MAG: hypothetical protein ACYDCB_11305, partial [Candidatus Dormibacteria bacterium]